MVEELISNEWDNQEAAVEEPLLIHAYYVLWGIGLTLRGIHFSTCLKWWGSTEEA